MSYINWPFVVKTVAIVCAAWLPIYLMYRLRKKIDPNDYEKLMS
jgi:hypothetical protein